MTTFFLSISDSDFFNIFVSHSSVDGDVMTCCCSEPLWIELECRVCISYEDETRLSRWFYYPKGTGTSQAAQCHFNRKKTQREILRLSFTSSTADCGDDTPRKPTRIMKWIKMIAMDISFSISRTAVGWALVGVVPRDFQLLSCTLMLPTWALVLTRRQSRRRQKRRKVLCCVYFTNCIFFFVRLFTTLPPCGVWVEVFFILWMFALSLPKKWKL